MEINMTDNMGLVLELIGTVAFAVSGAVVGIEKKMDIFGVVILGVTTAIGGGIIRDLVLGITPPMTFRDPIYVATAVVTSLIVFLPWVRKTFNNNKRVYDLLMLIMDTLGLGIFTVVGIKGAHYAYLSTNYRSLFLMGFVGVITGVGGGVLRDVLAGNRPYIFVKHFYACASMIGALQTAIIWDAVGQATAMAYGTITVVILRFMAAWYKWELPKASDYDDYVIGKDK